MINRDIFIKGAEQMDVVLHAGDIEKFSIYLEELKLWNKKINLTAIKKDEEIITNHFLDSLAIVKYINPDSTLLDIGSGAGFPGVPVALSSPDCFVTCCDSVGKKIMFIIHIVRKLGLQNVKTISGRVGKGEQNLQLYDYVVTRAVSDLLTVIKLSRPYTKKSGKIIAMRGEKGKDELEDVSGELDSLGLEIEKIDEFELPHCRAKRVNIIFKKSV
ncbi:MAG: 16S rRNA (guanine(527)-N(7))-methyltransferase RsmG [Candidatus Dadabacteria bacterium]|nr:16S rRNA (guanine(527)-N(7))-methyltransferase RsmG [Candidatus Dadabacteria bacterium]NIV41931.1 16S rRNA (guanine(527)-N(7))-methyltransferase RsmG [Candidatus Dadabacteria bacterium]NIX15802.1 16S rRNA (guanine(527)-N(7))-methyltransferase RsmG [Candidatus Dadabacteria bacterium]